MADPGDLTCQEFVELVTDYLEGVLPDGERARFEEHITSCDYCLGYLDQIRLTIRIVGHLNGSHLAPAARQLLLAEFRGWKREMAVGDG